MSRQPISLSGSTHDMLVMMAEGNPGGLSILMQIVQRDDPRALMDILSLDDMNIRGSQIWVGYKDHCDQDLERFVQAIRDRDQTIVDTINAECFRPDMNRDGYREKAVTGGASFEHVAGQRPDVRGMGY